MYRFRFAARFPYMIRTIEMSVCFAHLEVGDCILWFPAFSLDNFSYHTVVTIAMAI